MNTLPSQETLARLDEILATPAGRRVGVLGLGVVGQAMALRLRRLGAEVVGADLRAALADEAGGRALASAGVELRLGAMDAATLADVEAVAIGPGVHPDQPAVIAMRRRGVPIFGELELCGVLPAPVVAITGTNGKSTTTALLGALVRGCGVRAFVGGNLGDPVVSWLESGESADVAVLELSSFQLETAYRFAPDVAVVLNVTPDHIDRYADFAAYARTKELLVRQTRPAGVVVLNHDDPVARAMADSAAAPVWWFSTREASLPGDGALLAGDAVRAFGAAAALDGFALDHPRLLGRHNRENALAALLAEQALAALGIAGSQPTALARAYAGFAGLPHRLEWVAELQGVAFINDSKATNDQSAATAVRAIERPQILLLGGRDKGAGYGDVVAAAPGRVRRVIAFGEAREVIRAAVSESLQTSLATDLDAALEQAVALARPGDAILLSPACSSFDAFRHYAARGDHFKAWVRARAGAEAS